MIMKLKPTLLELYWEYLKYIKREINYNTQANPPPGVVASLDLSLDNYIIIIIGDS